MACCANPKPRLLEKNGRMFCDNCHRYLSRAAEPPEPPDPPDLTDADEIEPPDYEEVKE